MSKHKFRFQTLSWCFCDGYNQIIPSTCQGIMRNMNPQPQGSLMDINYQKGVRWMYLLAFSSLLDVFCVCTVSRGTGLASRCLAATPIQPSLMTFYFIFLIDRLPRNAWSGTQKLLALYRVATINKKKDILRPLGVSDPCYVLVFNRAGWWLLPWSCWLAMQPLRWFS